MPACAELPLGYRLVALGSVASTNSEAMQLAATGDPGRAWIVADEQVRGRGRSGRTWTSVPGNLYSSLLMRLSCAPQIAQQLALVAGVAVVDAVRAVNTADGLKHCGSAPLHDLRLKWPNDVLIGTAKLGGILLESSQGLGGPGLVAVIGIGLNVAGVPDGLGRAATSLVGEGVIATRDQLLGALAFAMDSTLTIWNEGIGFAAIRNAWQERAGRLGEALIVNTGSGPVAGRYGGLDADGALVLMDDVGGRSRFTYGDVTLAAASAKS